MEPIVTLRGVRRVQDKEQGGTEELEEVGGEVRKDKDHMRAIRMRLNRRHALVKLRSSCAMRTRAWEKLTCACYVHAVRCARSVHVLAHLVGYRGFLSSVNEICEPKKLKNPVQGNECNKMQNSYTIMVQYSRHRVHWRSPAGWAGTTLYMSRLRICRPARERENSIISMHILESSPSSEVGCTSDCRTWELLKNVVVWVSQCRSSNLPQQQVSSCLTMNFLPPLAADIPSSNLVYKKQIDLKVSLHAGGVTVKTSEVQRPVHWCSTVDFELPRALCVLGLSDIENSCTVPLSFFPLPPHLSQHALEGLEKKNCFECILATGLSVLDSQHLFFLKFFASILPNITFSSWFFLCSISERYLLRYVSSNSAKMTLIMNLWQVKSLLISVRSCVEMHRICINLGWVSSESPWRSSWTSPRFEILLLVKMVSLKPWYRPIRFTVSSASGKFKFQQLCAVPSALHWGFWFGLTRPLYPTFQRVSCLKNFVPNFPLSRTKRICRVFRATLLSRRILVSR